MESDGEIADDEAPGILGDGPPAGGRGDTLEDRLSAMVARVPRDVPQDGSASADPVCQAIHSVERVLQSHPESWAAHLGSNM